MFVDLFHFSMASTCRTLKICLQFSHVRCRMSTMKVNRGSPFDELETGQTE
jgi:hypothetical protein